MQLVFMPEILLMLFDNALSFYRRTPVEVSISYNNRYEIWSVAMPQIPSNKCCGNFKWNKVRNNQRYFVFLFFFVIRLVLKYFIVVFINHLYGTLVSLLFALLFPF